MTILARTLYTTIPQLNAASNRLSATNDLEQQIRVQIPISLFALTPLNILKN
jgi:hypothetical protein